MGCRIFRSSTTFSLFLLISYLLSLFDWLCILLNIEEDGAEEPRWHCTYSMYRIEVSYMCRIFSFNWCLQLVLLETSVFGIEGCTIWDQFGMTWITECCQCGIVGDCLGWLIKCKENKERLLHPQSPLGEFSGSPRGMRKRNFYMEVVISHR